MAWSMWTPLLASSASLGQPIGPPWVFLLEILVIYWRHRSGRKGLAHNLCKNFEDASRIKAERAIVRRSSIARSPYREFLGHQRHPYIVFRFKFLYGFMFVCVYIYICTVSMVTALLWKPKLPKQPSVGHQWCIDIPLVLVHSCGQFSLEWVFLVCLHGKHQLLQLHASCDSFCALLFQL